METNYQGNIYSTALFTDFYQLSMCQAYFKAEKHEQIACYDYFFRNAPFKGAYVLFAGLGDVIEKIQNFQFQSEHLEYLKGFRFEDDFLDYLSTLHFSGKIKSAKEGEVVFAHTPILQVEAPIIQGQIIETFLLNTLNFQSLIATKASRIKFAARGKTILEFGLRRAQGDGGIQATKGSIIGGCSLSSNVLAGWKYDIPVGGTMAHAWIQSFDDELTAFRFFAKIYPDNCTLLVDTYDTIKSGVPNAIIIAKELEAAGHRLNAIRLDSGDLAALSQKSRKMLDENGLQYVKISATNDLDEYIIKSLLEQNAPIDTFGVGTNLVTSKDQPALGGVYKLVEINGEPRIKISETTAKISIPGLKTIYRFYENDKIKADAVCLLGEPAPEIIYHPYNSLESLSLKGLEYKEVLHTIFENGDLKIKPPTVMESKSYAEKSLATLSDESKRLEFPQSIFVGLSPKLKHLMEELISEKRMEINS